MAAQSHIAVAAESGMKAGLKAYRAQLSRSGLATVKTQREMLSEMGRAAFPFYCAKFGADVKAYIEQTSAPVREVEPEASPLAQEIAEARARLETLIAQAEAPKPVRERKPAKAKTSETKPHVWRQWAINKHGLPTSVGATFTYKGKRRTSKFQVLSIDNEGSLVTQRVA